MRGRIRTYRDKIKEEEIIARRERIEKMRSDVKKILMSKYYDSGNSDKLIDALVDMMEKANDEILTMDEVAKLIKFPKSYVSKHYNSWRDYGLRVLITHPNARPRFWRSDIIKVLEAWK